MKKTILFNLLFVLLMFTLQQCTVQKRNYRKGFYIAYNKNYSPLKKVPEKSHTLCQTQNKKPQVIFSPNETKPKTIIVNNSAEYSYDFTSKPEANAAEHPSNNNIFYKNKTNIIANNLENKPVSIAESNKNIKRESTPPTEKDAFKNERKINGFGLASILCSLFSLLVIPGAFAIVFGIISLSKAKKHPVRYYGNWMGIVGIIIGALVGGGSAIYGALLLSSSW